MSMNDLVSDLLARIRNGQSAKHKTVVCRSSQMSEKILDVLQEEGYIKGYQKEDLRPGVSQILVELKYFEGAPVIKMLKRISTPGRRVYTSIGSLKKVCNGLGVAVLSTSKGVISDVEARRLNLGGEVLFEVY